MQGLCMQEVLVVKLKACKTHLRAACPHPPSCHLSELQYVRVQGYCMKQPLLMDPDSMQDLVLGLPSALHLLRLLHNVD